MNDNTQDNNRAARVVTAAALISIFIYSLVVSLPGVLINEVVETFSLEGTDEGLMGSLTSLGFLFSLFFAVLIQGRVKKITVMIIAYASQAFVLFVSGFSPTFVLFCIGCTLVGFSGGFIDSYSNSSVVDVRKNESAKYLGILHGLFGVGSLLAPLMFTWLLSYIDWRGVHYSLAIASIAVVLLIFLLTRRTGKKKDTTMVREQLFTKVDLYAYFKIKRNIALSLTGFFAMFTIVCVMIWIVRYMTLRYDAAGLGAISITVYWIFSTITRFFLARFVKRAPMLYFSLGAVMSGIFIIIGVISGSPVIMCIMMGLFGLCSGHFIPVLISECAVGYEGRTTFTTSIIMFFMCIARVSGPILIAFVSTQTSLMLGMMLPVAGALAAAGCGWMVIKAGDNSSAGILN